MSNNIGEGWAVSLLNDDTHSFDEVVKFLITSVSMEQDVAVHSAAKAHRYGKAVVAILEEDDAFMLTSRIKESGFDATYDQIGAASSSERMEDDEP